jgi:hypothetical protein
MRQECEQGVCGQCTMHLSALQVRVPKEETTLVSDLRYGWRKLRKLTTDVSDNLARLQVRFIFPVAPASS